MHPDVHKYLDGELARSALTQEAEAELRDWESLDNAVMQRRGEQAPPWLVDDVMRALPTPQPAPWRRAWQWLMTPQPMRVPPLAPLAAAALLAFLLVLPRGDTGVAPPISFTPELATNTAANTDAPVIYVQFAINAANARTVSVAGDFNEWSTDVGALRDPDGDGVWSGLVAVKPGVHKYMFVIDGAEWVTDPKAEGYVDDGFGMKNALLAVAPPARAL